jgi:exodeoxyribonuclease III
MKIISWNVNGLRAVEKKSEIQNLIAVYSPDIVFMQEIKWTPDKFSAYLNSPDPYIAYYNPAEKAGYAGTGAWIHSSLLETYSISFFSSFPWDPVANEWRVAHVTLTHKVSGEIIDIFGIYFPNGGKSEEAWAWKLVFYREFSAYMHSLRFLRHSVLWGWDINCAHHPIDLARPEANDGKIGFHPMERAWLDSCESESWHDIWREKNPNMPEVYSWWDPVTRSRDRNVGWRIDALWWDDSIIAKTRNIEYLQNQMGSDHCPMMIELEM